MTHLILHIGTHKTGTTSLQRFFQLNKDELAKQGVTVPLMPGKYRYENPDRNGHFLTRYIMLRLRPQNYNPKFLDIAQKDVDMFKDVVRDSSTVLLSEERIWYEATGVDEYVHELKQVLKDCGIDKVTIVVYIRRQDKLIESYYRQMIEDRNSETRTFDEFSHLERSIAMMDYKRGISRFEAEFGNECIVVRPFEPQSFTGGDIYHDFCAACGIEFTDDMEIPPRSLNASTGPNVTEVKRTLNAIPAFHKKRNNPFRIATIDTGAVSSEPQGVSYLTQEQRDEMLSHFATGNEEIAREYLRREDGELFGADSKEASTWDPSADELLHDAILFFGNLFVQQTTQQKELSKRIAKQNEYIERLEQSFEHLEQRTERLEQRTERLEAVNRNSLFLKAERKARGRSTLEGKKDRKN